jgi:hypothetical protein
LWTSTADVSDPVPMWEACRGRALRHNPRQDEDFGDDPSPGAPPIPPTPDMPGTWDDERLRDDVAALRERLAVYGP